MALYIYSLYLLTSFSKGREIPVLLIILAVSVISLANFYRLYNNSSNINYYSRFSGKMINIADKINFISGKTNYAELYQKRWGHISLGLNIQKLIGHNNKVMVMNFLPGLYGIPGSKFQRSLMNDYNRDVDFRTVMFGDTEESITTLKKYNINYFLIDLNRPLLLLPIAFSPLFEPKNLKRNFKIVASFDSNILLLTWKKKQGAEIDNDFILTYSQHYENRKNNFFFRVYHAVKEILERCCSNFKLDSTKGCIPKNL
ncbi:MAG: hypothetical protein GY795_38145 [Desulfobacterales bacterium]|nr:hypothetical protein [Desulfobacterales bacterium]